MSDDPIGGACSIAALACVELCVGFYTSIISTRMYLFERYHPLNPDISLFQGERTCPVFPIAVYTATAADSAANQISQTVSKANATRSQTQTHT